MGLLLAKNGKNTRLIWHQYLDLCFFKEVFVILSYVIISLALGFEETKYDLAV